MVLHGDSLLVLKDFPDNSVDAIVTDPPYGLAFMGKKWDYSVPKKELWAEVLRVLKPGGHLLSFGGTRTYHRMVVEIEDAGFEIRDQIMWLYGSGFPKSLDVSKAIDKAAGAEREVIGPNIRLGDTKPYDKNIQKDPTFHVGNAPTMGMLTAPATDDARKWQGFGTALKPANEPIVLARKPLERGLTVAQNVLKWGTGALAIDASRIGTDEKLSSGRHTTGDQQGPSGYKTTNRTEYAQNAQGRWPANVLFDEEAAEALDAQTQHLHGAGAKREGGLAKQTREIGSATSYDMKHNPNNGMRFGDSGGASRFFYVAKASKRERGEGNVHPTVKPIKLMEYLIKMITPPNGIVLDPFTGSGTTGVAAVQLGYDFIGIEMTEEYVTIANKRIDSAKPKPKAS